MTPAAQAGSTLHLCGREEALRMPSTYLLVIGCGVLALLYGLVTSRQVLSANAGSARMQEISGAVLTLARTETFMPT